MKDLKKNIISTATRISTPPNRNSWEWKGVISVLSFTLLYGVFLVRLLSLLQISKYLLRQHNEKKDRASTDTGSKRSNVPSWFVEAYFIFIAITLYILAYFFNDSKVMFVVCFYFLLESSVWVLYYHVLRRFYEEKYAIMHALEYFVLIPIVILIQGTCVYVLEESPSVLASMTAILNPLDTTPVYVCILNILYIAVVLGIIISNLPSERVKVQDYNKYNISIIGAGDVTNNRLIPAIKRYQSRLRIALFDIKFDKEAKSKNIKDKDIWIVFKRMDEDYEKTVLNSNILWIATPSYCHLDYLEQFINKDVFCVVEKPITSIKSEYPLLKQLMANRDKIFCLSYYYQEKALPLTYLFNSSAFYEKYLTFPEGKSRVDILCAISMLGQVKSVEIYLLEQNDDRTWLKEPKYGGQYMETFIHLVLMNKMIWGQDQIFEDLEWQIGNFDSEWKDTYISCKGKANDGYFALYMGKRMPSKRREGIIRFENGMIHIDFETSRCTCTFNDSDEHDFFIYVDSNKWGKYSVQLDMVMRCYSKDIDPSIMDGSSLQMDTLDWLFNQDLSEINRFGYSEKEGRDLFPTLYNEERFEGEAGCEL